MVRPGRSRVGPTQNLSLLSPPFISLARRCVCTLSLNSQGTPPPPKPSFLVLEPFSLTIPWCPASPGCLQGPISTRMTMGEVGSCYAKEHAADPKALTLLSRGVLQACGLRVSPRAMACEEGCGPSRSSEDLCPLCVPVAGRWTSVGRGP